MKDKIVWGAIGVIVVSFIANFIYYQSKQLDEPLVLEHYVELSYNIENTMRFKEFELYYLTNKDETQLNHFMNDHFYASVYDSGGYYNHIQPITYVREYNHHLLKRGHVEIMPHTVEVNNEGKLYIKDAQFAFKEPGGMTYYEKSIGHILIRPYDPNDNPPLHHQISSGSTNGIEMFLYKTDEKITINNIYLPFPELKEDILLKMDVEQGRLDEINRKGASFISYEVLDQEWTNIAGNIISSELFPVEMEEGEFFALFVNFANSFDKYHDFSIRIEGKDANGETFINYVPIIYAPQLNQQTVNELTTGGGAR